MDKRLDVCAARPRLKPKKLFFSAATREGMGYADRWDQHSGMQIDISRAFFQAEAIRNVYAELLAEDAEQGARAMLNKSMQGTRDAIHN